MVLSMGLAASVHADARVPLALASGPGEPLPPIVGEPIPTEYHPARVLVRFRADATTEAIAAITSKAGVLSYVHSYRLVPGLHCVQVAIGGVDKAIEVLSADAAVQYAERDHWRFAMMQNTPYGIDMVRAPLLWATSQGAGGTVAVLDTGVDLTHPDLPVPVLHESFIPGQTVDDYHDHGTHCSGTVLALNNDIGVVGVAPQASLMIGKVLSNGGSGPTSGVMAGCEWASMNGANVISMSLGGGGENQAELDLYTAITANNVLIVAAAGNGNTDVPSFPGSYPPVMCVAAIDSSMNRASFSNFGATIDISAPGVGVESTIPDETFAPEVTWNDTVRPANLLTGSGQGSITAPAIFCGFGNPEEFPPGVMGNIAHVRRRGTSTATGTNLTFREKAENAIAAGAIGVIISNDGGGNSLFSGTLNTNVDVPVVGVSQNNGNDLEAMSGVSTTINTQVLTPRPNPYAFFNGTSMATPHVAGVAGLLVGYFGESNVDVADLRFALESSAEDLGDPGRDDLYGWGLVRADLARDVLATLVDTCAADFNGDGNVDPDDLGDFINCYFGVPACDGADFNADGNVDPDDLGDFINTYFAGC
ncbi:MAG: S8 family serine peptidase [Phycisphaerales bacterium]